MSGCNNINLTPEESIALAIADGKLSNAEVVNIFGYQISVGNSFIPIWENATTYTYPGGELTMTAVSSSASDTANTVTVVGLDSNYEVVSDSQTLNGTSAVTLSGTDFFRINSVIITGGVNVGAITIVNGGTTYAQVRAGDGKSQAAIYTVPAGKSFFLYRLNAFSPDATTANYAAFRNFVVNNGSGTAFLVGQTGFLNELNIQRRFPFKYGEKTDLQFQGRSETATAVLISAFGEGLLVDN